MQAPRTPMATVAASISSNAPAPRSSPQHRTSSGAARPRAKATSAGVASAMCAERSSTRHAASVGRSAMRRATSSASITPDSRAEGSANGGAHETAMSHGKARRRKRSAAPPRTADAAAPPDVLCSTVCAIVPLYPNDDTPPERSKSSSWAAPRIGVSCTGQRAICPAPRVAAATIGLRTRSCALPAAVPRDKRSIMRARPASPAAGSR
eukprot:scaffold15029_cov78-Phaeocystis_antarctica.AAC.5